ncbi:MAG: ATP-grasp domain-containing protein [Bacteroidetes bacterium]|nr:ATP-grasp domain-containing protein [Bacteroidota bacterium]MCH8034736.1 ATP-grasp domain-containing protein [Bacteroidota bacterium]
MKILKILVTGVGAPGILGTLYSLKNNIDNRSVYIIGTDSKLEVVGKYVCDKFFRIPHSSLGDEYLGNMEKICHKEGIDIVIPQNTFELSLLSKRKKTFERKGTRILISDPRAIEISNNKYLLMGKCKEIGIPVGKFKIVNKFEDLKIFARKLGWPKKKIVIKPPISNGLRGVRIIDENFDSKKAFYLEKPTSLTTKMDDLYGVIGDSFPELIVTEFLSGIEYTVDVFRYNGQSIVIPRVRELIRSGITFTGNSIKHKKIIEYSHALSKNIGLEYCFGFQFKLDGRGCPKILESNPRVQGTMVLSTFSGANIIYLSVKALLGESFYLPKINWNTRLLRYWGGIAVYDEKQIGRL